MRAGCSWLAYQALDARLSLPISKVHFWRDKQQREIDFVIPRGRNSVDALECKWNAEAYEPAALAVFRASYAKGRNFVLCPGVKRAFERRIGKQLVVFLPLEDCRKTLSE